MINRIINWIIRWLKRQFIDPFTVAADLGPFWTPINTQETLIHVKGLLSAKHQARKWVSRHTNGKARVLKGWKYWPEEQLEGEMNKDA